jgi:hypothetical protein
MSVLFYRTLSVSLCPDGNFQSNIQILYYLRGQRPYKMSERNLGNTDKLVTVNAAFMFQSLMKSRNPPL